MAATSGGGQGTPTDWKKLQDLMSKRVTVNRVQLSCMCALSPGSSRDTTCLIFDDPCQHILTGGNAWGPKVQEVRRVAEEGNCLLQLVQECQGASIFCPLLSNDSKQAALLKLIAVYILQRTIPAGGTIISVTGKKDDSEVIVPEETFFEWNAGSTLAFGAAGITPTTKAKVFLYHRFTLSSKGECSWYAPLFAVADFRKEDMSYEDDAKEIAKLYADFTEEHPLWAAEEIAVQWPVAGKMDKAALFALFKGFTDCQREVRDGSYSCVYVRVCAFLGI